MGCGCGESIAEVVGVSGLRGGELYGRWGRGGVGDGKAGFDEYDRGRRGALGESGLDE